MYDYDVIFVIDGEQGLEKYNDGIYDLCIFDVMMFKKDGFILVKEICEKDEEMFIIFFIVKMMKEDVVKGFKIGVDDYIFKFFNFEELFYCIQVIFKWSQVKVDFREEIKEFSIGKYYFNFFLCILMFDFDGLEEEENKLLLKEV